MYKRRASKRTGVQLQLEPRKMTPENSMAGQRRSPGNTEADGKKVSEGISTDKASEHNDAQTADSSAAPPARPPGRALRVLKGAVKLVPKIRQTTAQAALKLVAKIGPRTTPGETVADVENGSERFATDKASGHNDAPAAVIPGVAVDEKYRPLFEAARKGEWGGVENILNHDDEAMKAEFVTVGDISLTVLDFAVITAPEELVEKLIKRLPPEDKEKILKSAIFNAARIGSKQMVKAMVDSVESDSKMEDGSKSEMVRHALLNAIRSAPTQKKVIWFLAKRTKSAPDFETIRYLILAGHLAMGCFLAHKHRGLVTFNVDDKRSLLKDMAKIKSYFPSGAGLNLLEKFIYNCIPQFLVDASYETSKDTETNRVKRFNILAKEPVFLIRRMGALKFRHNCSLEFAKLALKEMKDKVDVPKRCEYLLSSGIVLDAASCGTSEIVELCLDQFPEVMYDKNFPIKLMKEVVKGRQVELFRLVDKYNRIPKLSDDIFMNHDLMEAVVQWPPERVPTDVPGAVFLMQSELQWFKVLEERSDPSFKSLKFEVLEEISDPYSGSQKFKVPEETNDPSSKSQKFNQKFKVWNPSKSLKFEETKYRKGKTYWEVFVEQREGLLKEAGEWMKQTSSSCSVVAALVITVTFAAAFTVPGGYEPNTGIPIFLKKGSFMVFAITDALALFFSVTATLMFLAIVTPYYTIEDFLQSLPRKMIMGITSLFLSLAFMLVAFSSALTIILSERWKWIFFPIAFLAAVPVCFFLHMHFPMYVKMVEATYWPRLRRPMKIPK